MVGDHLVSELSDLWILRLGRCCSRKRHFSHAALRGLLHEGGRFQPVTGSHLFAGALSLGHGALMWRGSRVGTGTIRGCCVTWILSSNAALVGRRCGVGAWRRVGGGWSLRVRSQDDANA